MTDRIEIRDLRVTGIHGVLPEEHARAQPFSVDITAWVDMAAAQQSDDLADTVDYGALAEAAAGVVGGRSYRLLEALAGRLADALLIVDPRLEAVEVTVRKLRPPLPLDVGSTGVRVRRSRVTDARRAFIGLGSNLGDRRAHLREAVEGLRAGGDVVAVSPLYETAPVGGPAGQDRYLNLVVELLTADSPRALLERGRALEAAAERVRRERWGPRTLDADVLWVEGEQVDEADLTVPHPRLWERRFVLAPLADLAPDLVTSAQVQASGGDVVRRGSL